MKFRWDVGQVSMGKAAGKGMSSRKLDQSQLPVSDFRWNSSGWQDNPLRDGNLTENPDPLPLCNGG